MVKTKRTKWVKPSTSPKDAMQSKSGLLKMPTSRSKIRWQRSAHKSQKLNEWTPKEMEQAVTMYRELRAPGYKSK